MSARNAPLVCIYMRARAVPQCSKSLWTACSRLLISRLQKTGCAHDLQCMHAICMVHNTNTHTHADATEARFPFCICHLRERGQRAFIIESWRKSHPNSDTCTRDHNRAYIGQSNEKSADCDWVERKRRFTHSTWLLWPFELESSD